MAKMVQVTNNEGASKTQGDVRKSRALSANRPLPPSTTPIINRMSIAWGPGRVWPVSQGRGAVVDATTGYRYAPHVRTTR